MDYGEQQQALALTRDPDFRRGLNGLVKAFTIRWLREGSGTDAVSVEAGNASGPLMRLLIAATPLTDEGIRTLEAGERAFYRAVRLHATELEKGWRQ